MSIRDPMQNDIDALRTRAGDQDVKQARLEIAISMLTKQCEDFTKAIGVFSTTVQDIQIALTVLRGQNTNTNRIIAAIGAVLLTGIGVILGQFVHIHP